MAAKCPKCHSEILDDSRFCSRCIFRLKAASDSGSIRPLLGRNRNAKRRWITIPKWAKISPLKGGSNGPNEVIHAKN